MNIFLFTIFNDRGDSKVIKVETDQLEPPYERVACASIDIVSCVGIIKEYPLEDKIVSWVDNERLEL